MDKVGLGVKVGHKAKLGQEAKVGHEVKLFLFSFFTILLYSYSKLWPVLKFMRDNGNLDNTKVSTITLNFSYKSTKLTLPEITCFEQVRPSVSRLAW